MQINRDTTQEYKYRVDYEYKVKYKVIITNHTEYKYETPYKGTFLITQCFTNGTVNLQYCATQITYNICCINPSKSDTKVGDFDSINMFDEVNI